MKTIRGKSFVGQRIVLDGKVFVDCHFKDSNLVIEGNNLFEMQNCRIEEDCRLAVEGPGKVLLHTLKMMLYSGGWMSRVAENVLLAVRQPPKVRAPAAPVQQAAQAPGPETQSPPQQAPQSQEPQAQAPQGDAPQS
ncbi:MAG TPA: hypothetical protein VIL28_11475 [Steroidobacteraceae bacterium]